MNNSKKLSSVNQKINTLQQQIASMKKQSAGRNSKSQKKANVANLSSSSSGAQRKVKTHVVSQTERIGTILASGTPDYSVVSLSINPGITFPWLSTQARLYDKYKFSKLVFKFKTSGPTINFGSVGLGFDYNPLSGNPVTSEEFSQLTNWKLQSAWENFSINIDVNNTMIPYLYTRSATLGGTDLKTYDIGRLYMVCEGIPATVAAGTLLGYVEADYTVHLVNKQPDLKTNVLSNSMISVQGDRQDNGTSSTSSATIYMGTLPKNWVVNNLDLGSHTITSYAPQTSINSAVLNNCLVLEPGVYFITCRLHSKPTDLVSVDFVDENGLTISSSSSENISTMFALTRTTTLVIKITMSAGHVITYSNCSPESMYIFKY